MPHFDWKKLLNRHTRKAADQQGQLAAIQAVQAVIEFDLQGHVLHANDNFLKATGYTLAEIQGQHHRMFVDEATRNSAEYAAFWQRLGQGQHDAGRYRRIAKDGREIWLQASYTPIFDSHGQPFKVVKYATDITARHMAAATLRSAVEGLCDSVQRSTQARTLAEQASKVAESGGHTVHEVMDTMERISASSRKIGDIIGVMNTIAFQTNLLALNAAVEAARAGEQGRGFAVVAAEVRNLAQHSAAAAKEIKQLIEVSCQQVNCGAEQVRKAGQTMQDIMDASKQVTTIIHEVAEAAVHQSAQLRAVTEALDHRPQDPAPVPELAPPPAVTSMPVFSFAPTPRPGALLA